MGEYTVTFPGWGTIGRSTVAACRAAGATCRNTVWGGGAVNLSCHDSSGAAVDANFTVLIFGNQAKNASPGQCAQVRRRQSSSS